MPTPITVLIPCKNERDNIAACIDSAKDIADEILIADSGSTDGTLELVKARSDCRVIEREYRCSADFKNWAIPQARNEWILLIDADERVTPSLAEEIRQMKHSGALDRSPVDAYAIPRENYFLGNRIRYCGWQNDRVRRLFRRSCRYQERRVHAELDLPPSRSGDLTAPFTHFTFRSIRQYHSKFELYATWGAQSLHERGRRASAFSLLVRPCLRFFRDFVLKRGFLEGKAGLVLCCLSAFSVFFKYAKLWEMEVKQESAPNLFGSLPQVSCSVVTNATRAA